MSSSANSHITNRSFVSGEDGSSANLKKKDFTSTTIRSFGRGHDFLKVVSVPFKK